MREAVVVDMVRTPFGRAGQRGAFRDITHVELVTSLLKDVLERNKLPAEEVDEVLMGSVAWYQRLVHSGFFSSGQEVGSISRAITSAVWIWPRLRSSPGEIGCTRSIVSTPPARTTSDMSHMIANAPWATAWREEPHCLFMSVAETVKGRPASNR